MSLVARKLVAICVMLFTCLSLFAPLQSASAQGWHRWHRWHRHPIVRVNRYWRHGHWVRVRRTMWR